MKKIILIGSFISLFLFAPKSFPILAVGQSCITCASPYYYHTIYKLCCKDTKCTVSMTPLNNCNAGEKCDNVDPTIGKCIALVNTPTPTPKSTSGGKCGPSLVCNDNQSCEFIQGPNIYYCKDIKGLKIGNSYSVDNPVPEFNTPASIINKLIPYLFTFAGIALLVVLIASGFSYLTSGGDEKKVEQARGKITAAFVGFIIMLAAYWLVQIVEYLFHIKIF